jgi:chemotaxis protein CheD
MSEDRIIYISQGEYKTSTQPADVLSTVLGSCVAACIWDPVRALGGMNHFLLPASHDTGNARSLRYGAHAMEMLINDLLKQGAVRGALQAKLFGGANMASNLGDIGASNARFAKNYLETEGIPCLAESLGGTNARRVLFRPATGHVRQMLVVNTELVERPAPAMPAPKPAAQVTLF